jgi:hypothetical protein
MLINSRKCFSSNSEKDPETTLASPVNDIFKETRGLTSSKLQSINVIAHAIA